MNIKAKRIAPPTPEPAEPEPFFYPDIFHEEPTREYFDEKTPPPKERKTSNVVLTILGAFLLAFIVAMIVTFWVKGSVPDTLIQYTMGAGGVETLLLAGIKISKVVTGNKTGSDPPDGVG